MQGSMDFHRGMGAAFNPMMNPLPLTPSFAPPQLPNLPPHPYDYTLIKGTPQHSMMFQQPAAHPHSVYPSAVQNTPSLAQQPLELHPPPPPAPVESKYKQQLSHSSHKATEERYPKLPSRNAGHSDEEEDMLSQPQEMMVTSPAVSSRKPPKPQASAQQAPRREMAEDRTATPATRAQPPVLPEKSQEEEEEEDSEFVPLPPGDQPEDCPPTIQERVKSTKWNIRVFGLQVSDKIDVVSLRSLLLPLAPSLSSTVASLPPIPCARSSHI
eukprot:768564-Hanusia_phi.AAC.2